MTREIALRKFAHSFGHRYLEELAPRLASYLMEYGAKALEGSEINYCVPESEPFEDLQFVLRVIHDPFEHMVGPPGSWHKPTVEVDLVPLISWAELYRGSTPGGSEFGLDRATIKAFSWVDSGGVPPWMATSCPRQNQEQLDALASFCYYRYLQGDMVAITSRDLWIRYLLLPDDALPSLDHEEGVHRPDPKLVDGEQQ